MSRFLTRALFHGRVAISPAATAIPLFSPRALLPQLQASLFSTHVPQPASPREKGPKLRTPTPPPSKSQEELAQMPYLVRRTPSAQLPVYRRTKSGGTLRETHVKKVEGDRKKLAQELGGALSLDQKDVRVNPTTNHIEMKGHVLEEVKAYLLKLGF
ncbi:mitochondrial large subunit ribosomal protein [Hirsutella rhossiliensis]|uniref:Large ribosomal subunit protein mL49 n=1 Tax=Hirsutella rhossiliensis TaxID=111463 RepID=A0A9P8SJL6_9HYPO|nr:mitochondrial large subunit ribosomal protein [Hirsutella rhossiliensis]KAH0965433.1 mitochondrial large subunit ribosomal protein [Hirsutella rhossiliensis]